LKDLKTPKRTSWFRKITIAANIVAAIVLLLCYLNSYASPQQLWWVGFLGLGFPILAVINILFVLYWLFRWNLLLVISLIALLPGYRYFQQTIAFGKQELVLKNDAGILKVMSYNVRIFNLYEWGRNQGNNEEIIKLVAEQHPHIVCFQEFYTTENPSHKVYNMVKRMKEELGYKYFFFENTATLRKTDHWGAAIFSDYPIVDSGIVSFGKRTLNTCSYADIKVNKKTYRVFNMHLQSIHLAVKDYSYLDNIKLENDSDLTASKNILRKLKRAFIRRAKQSDLVAKAVSESPFPVIICGDFNDTPTSYTYATISKGLTDAFLQSGKGIGKTYVGIFPTLRIDFILLSKELESVQTQTIEKPFSDHYPLISYLRTAKN